MHFLLYNLHRKHHQFNVQLNSDFYSDNRHYISKKSIARIQAESGKESIFYRKSFVSQYIFRRLKRYP